MYSQFCWQIEGEKGYVSFWPHETNHENARQVLKNTVFGYSRHQFVIGYDIVFVQEIATTYSVYNISLFNKTSMECRNNLIP